LSTATKTKEPYLTEQERRIIVAIKLYRRAYKTGPPWGWIRQQTNLTRLELTQTMRRLHKQGFVWFSHEPGSVAARPKGVKAALGDDKQA
jgi:hypothetical protein